MNKTEDGLMWGRRMSAELKNVIATIFGADRYNYTTQKTVDEDNMCILEFNFQHQGFPYCRNITMKLLPVANRVEIEKVGTDGQTISLNIDEADKLQTLEWYRTIKQSFSMSSMVHDAIEMKRHINQKEWSITSMAENGTPSRYAIEAQRNGMALIKLQRDYSDTDNSATYKVFGYGNGDFIRYEYDSLDEALRKIYEYTTPSRTDVAYTIMERVHDITGVENKDLEETWSENPYSIIFTFKKSLLYDQIKFTLEKDDRKISIYRSYVAPSDFSNDNKMQSKVCVICAPYDVASIESAVNDIVGLQELVLYMTDNILPKLYPLTMSQVTDNTNTHKIELKVHNLEKDEARLEFSYDDKSLSINYLDGKPSKAITLKADDITIQAIIEAVDILMMTHNVKRIDEA